MALIKLLKGTNGEVELHEDKIVIKRKGLTNTILHGFKGDKSIPISMITSIQFKEPGFLTAGYIQFGIQGGIESRGGIYDAVKDENSITFIKKTKKDFIELKEYIENKIMSREKQRYSATGNNLDELEKLSDLLNKHIITEEEFAAKKKQILGI